MYRDIRLNDNLALRVTSLELISQVQCSKLLACLKITGKDVETKDDKTFTYSLAFYIYMFIHVGL